MARFISGELLVVDYGSIIEEEAGLKPPVTITMEQVLQYMQARQNSKQ